MLLTHIARFKYMMNPQVKNHRLEYFFLVLVCIIPQKFGSILIAIAYLNHNHTNIIRKNTDKKLEPTTNKPKDGPEFYTATTSQCFGVHRHLASTFTFATYFQRWWSFICRSRTTHHLFSLVLKNRQDFGG